MYARHASLPFTHMYTHVDTRKHIHTYESQILKYFIQSIRCDLIDEVQLCISVKWINCAFDVATYYKSYTQTLFDKV